jgi:hypothetical protein
MPNPVDALVQCSDSRLVREFGATPLSHDTVLVEATPRARADSFFPELAMLRDRHALDTPRVPDSIETHCKD